uniref:TPR_REGION domain-containing protein n=1 Tax=Ascaris lumbricoides TaxID=6252 RepID=A0A0M3I3I4_ASCLU
MQIWHIEDELYLEQDEAKGQRRMKSERLTDGLLLERKMAIINKALEANVDSVKLKIERLKIGCYIWEKEKLHREIADLEFYHVNDPEMWSGMLDVMKNERHWRLSDQLSKMDTCLDKISRVMSGQLRTHPALPGTEEFVATVIRRRIRLLMQSGYVEKAIASAQAICEYNLCLPEPVKKCTTADRRMYFKAFWESGIARIGDVGAKGKVLIIATCGLPRFRILTGLDDRWAKSIAALKAKEFVTDKEEYEKHQREYENAEKKLMTDGASHNLGPNKVWLELEKLRARWLWRPLRDLETNPIDLERFVAYEDIQDALFDFSENVAVELVLNILEDFGAVIFGRDPSSPENIMQQFAILFPDVSPHFHEFDQFIGRFFLQLVPYLPEHRTVLLCSHITSAFAFIQRNEDAGNQRVTFKRFREVAKEFFTYMGHAEEPSCVATFAEKFLELGDKKKAVALAELLHKKGNIWDLEDSSHQMAYLRLALVYVHTRESSAEKCDVLRSIVMRGVLPDTKNPQKYEGREVQRQLNLLLSKVFASGVVSRSEGSMIDLYATLTLLAVYYNGDDANSYRFLCSTYESLTNKLEPNRLPLFTKTFLSLLSSYLTENPSKSPKLLLNKLRDAACRYPTSTAILERFINQCQFGLNIIPLRRFLSEDIKEVNALRCRCYGAVYLELLRHAQQLTLNERHAPQIRPLMNVLRSAAERTQYEDDCFPRIALRIAKDRGDKELVEEVFYTARLNFPWSWALLIEFAESDPFQFVRLADTMIEKGIRLRTHSEELSILE